MKKGKITGLVLVVALLSLLALIVACVPAPATTPAAPPPKPKPVKITILTGGTAGVYFPLGGALAKIINEYVEGVEAAAVTSGASVTNARKIGEKEAELALLQNDIAAYAYNGTEMFKGKPVENIRGIATWYPEIIQFVTLKEFGIKTLGELKGKKVGIGAPGSGTAVEALAILGTAGVTRENADLRDLDFKEVSYALKDKTIHAGCIVAGIPTAAVMDVATVRDVYIVEIPDDIYQDLKARFPYFIRQSIPAGTYKGVDKDVKTVAVLAMLATRADMPEDVIYKITKAMFEHTDILVATHKRAKDITLETALEGMPIPLHPGAEKYYKEVGLIK